MSTPAVACVEVGGGSIQTVVLGDETTDISAGAHSPPGLPLLLAVPGLISGHRVLGAANLGWYDVDPVVELGLSEPASMVCNDAEAAALGEAVLRGSTALAGLVFVGLGTGVGGAVVRDGRVVAANLFGHHPGFGDAPCQCGRRGCLETVAGGWALPDPLSPARLPGVALAVATAILAEPLADGLPVVVAGGLARRHPSLVALVASAMAGREVSGTGAPDGAKSAAAWGLRHAYQTAGAIACA